MRDIDIETVTDGATYEGNGWRAEALAVDHSYHLHAYGYRFEEPASGASVVISGDTTPLDAMAEFASRADVLVHECNIVGDSETPLAPDAVHERYADAPYADYLEWIMSDDAEDEQSDINHTAPAGAGEIADEAGVDTLVLTHFNPLRNPEDIHAEATAEFDGRTVVAEDGMTFSA
jgi:ribonuclease BN (tRNA processing enzyme)